jgi:hypothetical protein
MVADGHRALFILVLALPFLGQGVPYPGGIPLFLPVAALLLPATVLLRIADKGVSGVVVGDGLFMAISTFVLLTYIYGILLSTDFPAANLFRDVLTGIVAMSIVFTIANSRWDQAMRNRLVVILAWTFLAIGSFIGAVGAYKLWLFVSHGETLDYVLAASSRVYPWGTSLVSDYNFYALTILTSILSGLYLCKERSVGVQLALALAVAGLIVVGFLAGSRRFWVVAPVFIVAQLGWMMSRDGIREYRPLLAVFFAVVLGVPMVLASVSEGSLLKLVSSGWDLQYRLSTLLDAGTGFGLRDRFEMWYAAADRLTGLTPWVGSGFDYMRWFSCEFADCSGDGYPHMPILSAYLYGGILATAAAIGLYVYVTIAGIRLMSHRGAISWLVFPMMAAFTFAAVSANGPFSIRSHIVLGALCVGFLYAEKVDAATTRAE